jgi:hypothetical protein
MDRNPMVATPRSQKFDEGTVATGDASLRTPSAIHPFVAKRQGAGPLRIGRVVALDHPLDGPPEPVVFGAGEIAS